MRPAKISIQHILTIANSLAPFSLAEEWDNVGLLIGDPGQEVTGIMIGLDPTSQLLDEALARNANLVITHHPLIFSPLKSIRTDQATGAVIGKAITQHIGIIACHTNLDVVPNGVSNILARHLGLIDLTPLSDSSNAEPGFGFGQIGTLAVPLRGHDFLSHLCKVLDLSAVPIVGHLPETIHRVAVCGGSGSDFAVIAHAKGAQLYITGEVKHHIARWVEEANFCIVDAGHFATEHHISTALAAQLTDSLANHAIEIPVYATERQINPFSFFIAENDQQPSKERYGH
ncbi:MAG: Nif3-like dinuclear metal center hexameric protein [Desulfobulbaceae bacterium]|nr:Nif3-like dinuclear metal center hexameric protein [Desulfobulbaceae bacterium]